MALEGKNNFYFIVSALSHSWLTHFIKAPQEINGCYKKTEATSLQRQRSAKDTNQVDYFSRIPVGESAADSKVKEALADREDLYLSRFAPHTSSEFYNPGQMDVSF